MTIRTSDKLTKKMLPEIKTFYSNKIVRNLREHNSNKHDIYSFFTFSLSPSLLLRVTNTYFEE